MKHLAIIVSAALAAAPTTARADELATNSVPAKARSLAERGRAAHDAGDYATAIAAFTQAYAMAPAPALLFNLAQAYRLQGNCDDAALMYRRYLETNPSPEARALAEGHLANVERCMHKMALHIPVEATPAVARTSVATRPALGATAALSRPSRAPEYEQDVGIGLAIGGTASLAVAGFYALRAHSASNDVADAYKKGGKWKDIAPIDARGQSASTRAKLFGAGGALGVAGGVITYLVGRHAEQQQVRSIAVVPTGHGVEVGMSWAF